MIGDKASERWIIAFFWICQIGAASGFILFNQIQLAILFPLQPVKSTASFVTAGLIGAVMITVGVWGLVQTLQLRSPKKKDISPRFIVVTAAGAVVALFALSALRVLIF